MVTAKTKRRPGHPAVLPPATAVPSITAAVVDMQPLTKSQIFSLLWMTLIVAYLFAGPRGYGPVPVELSYLLVGTTIFSLIVLGKRFPLFGYFTIIIFCGLFSALVGGRRGRR
jgi:hypothetical protein